MKTIRHILVPTDFSETARAAFDYAQRLAKRLDASITLAHAYELPFYGPDGSFLITEDLEHRLRAAAEDGVSDLVERRIEPSVAVAGAVVYGVPWEQIGRLAESTKADLLVLGTHGRGTIARAMLGSVAEKVVRTSPIPVITCHARTSERPFSMQRLLVPVDFGHGSELALEAASAWALQLGASLVLLHAYQAPIYGVPGGAIQATAELADRTHESLERSLFALADRVKASGVPATPYLRRGAAWSSIGATAEELECDLVVMCTHGRRSVSRALLGSVTEKVVRTCERPVLVVHRATPESKGS